MGIILEHAYIFCFIFPVSDHGSLTHADPYPLKTQCFSKIIPTV